MHWRAQCHAKRLRRCRAFQHSSGIEPKSPDSLWPALTSKPLVSINNRKRTVHELSYFATCNRFFCVQGCRTRIIQVEYQGQARNTELIEVKIFSLRTIFAQCSLSSSSSSTSKKRKLITWNLDRSSRSSYAWLVSNTVNECLQRQIAKKIFKSKI